jgi:hypothetical protein
MRLHLRRGSGQKTRVVKCAPSDYPIQRFQLKQSAKLIFIVPLCLASGMRRARKQKASLGSRVDWLQQIYGEESEASESVSAGTLVAL